MINLDEITARIRTAQQQKLLSQTNDFLPESVIKTFQDNTTYNFIADVKNDFLISSKKFYCC